MTWRLLMAAAVVALIAATLTLGALVRALGELDDIEIGELDS